MQNIIVEKLEKEIISLLEKLDSIDCATPEYDMQIEKIAKLYKTLNEEKKLSLDSRKIDIENDKIIKEIDIKRTQIETEVKKTESDIDLKNSQLKLDEKRIGVEHTKVNNDYELKERQLMDEDERFKADMKLKECELDSRIADIIAERDLKLKELKSNNVGTYVRVGVEVLAIAAPLAFYGVYMNKGFKFEETGTFTSQTLKGLFGKFKTTR